MNMTSAQVASTAPDRSNARKSATPPSRREIGSPELRQRMEHLLRLYPDISQEETEELLTFLRSGPHLDVGLVTGEEEFREKVRDIRTRYRGEFRLKLRESILFVALIIGPFLYLAGKYLF